jgi:phage terminase large subunit
MSKKEINFAPTLKQDEVFQLFNNDITTEVLFGGGVGSAKSYLLASIVTSSCLKYEGIRVGLARNELTTLKKTTVTTFFELFESWGLKLNQHFTYNSVAGSISFFNGSEVVFQELRFLPSDPDYTRLGGLLLTFGVIDEAGECDEKGKEIFQSRCGRWKNDAFSVKPFLLMTCNPSRNFLFDDFYLANKENRMAEHRSFVSATVYDNPYISSAYIDNLHKILSHGEIQRLLYGNWEFDGDPNNLCKLESIKNMYDHSIVLDKNKIKYISADIAFTSDACVIMVWEGMNIIEIKKLDKEANVEQEIKKLAEQHLVMTSNIAYDSDGVGKYLMNYLSSAKPIINNAKALQGENYQNLKTQLYFKLCEMIEGGMVKIMDRSFNKEIEQELISIKHKPRESSDGKIEMNSKAEVKRLIGRSPDFSDAMAYRMIFEISPKGGFDFSFINL